MTLVSVQCPWRDKRKEQRREGTKEERKKNKAAIYALLPFIIHTYSLCSGQTNFNENNDNNNYNNNNNNYINYESSSSSPST